MQHIAIIVNNEDMMQTVKDAVAVSNEDIRLIATHTYDESYDWGKRLEAEGYRVLIARGGHAHRLRSSNLGVPVVSIPFTGNNITSILLQATHTWGEFAVIGNHTLVQMARELEHAMKAQIHYCAISGWSDFETQVINIKNSGVKAVVGGYDACQFAKKHGLHTYCITTNQYEISAAIADAKTLLAALDRDKRWSDLFRSVLDTVHEGVVIIDSDYKITHLNRLAKKFLSDFVIGTRVHDPLYIGRIKRALNGGCIYDELTEADDYKYTCTTIPVKTGDEITEVVFVLQEVEYVQKIEQQVRQKVFKKGLFASKSFSDILGNSPVTRETIQTAKRYALVNSTILITGESGTGKEIFAQSIHNFSLRRNEAFVAVNCATIPPNLFESELFGYVEGAFTGAKHGGKTGLFELAHNGTIFLDEIGEMPLNMQARLLRVLEERQIMRVGGDQVIPINIRVIAATNKDLLKMVDEETFRSDLYYRLNVLPLKLRPLRERKEDLHALIGHFIKKYADEHSRNQFQFTDAGMDTMMRYSWRGNTRELKNVIERLVVTNASGIADAEEVGEALGVSVRPPAKSSKDFDSCLLSDNEMDMIRKVMEEVRGNKTEAAKRLGISRPTLHRKLKQMEGG